MSETLNDAVPELVNTPPESKKKRGFAAHKPDCQCRFHKRQRGEALSPAPGKAKLVLDSPIKDELSAGAPTQRELTENTDKVLEHFEYTLNESDVAIWSTDASASPVNPPKKVAEKYPEFEFKLGSLKKLEEKGEGYKGWIILKDKSLGYPDGIKRSGDSVFLVRTKALGAKVEAAKAKAAEDQVRGIADIRNAEMARRTSQGDPTVIAPLSRGPVQSRMAGLGIVVGRSAARMAREHQEDTGKKFFDMGRR